MSKFDATLLIIIKELFKPFFFKDPGANFDNGLRGMIPGHCVNSPIRPRPLSSHWVIAIAGSSGIEKQNYI